MKHICCAVCLTILIFSAFAAQDTSEKPAFSKGSPFEKVPFVRKKLSSVLNRLEKSSRDKISEIDALIQTYKGKRDISPLATKKLMADVEKVFPLKPGAKLLPDVLSEKDIAILNAEVAKRFNLKDDEIIKETAHEASKKYPLYKKGDKLDLSWHIGNFISRQNGVFYGIDNRNQVIFNDIKVPIKDVTAELRPKLSPALNKKAKEMFARMEVTNYQLKKQKYLKQLTRSLQVYYAGENYKNGFLRLKNGTWTSAREYAKSKLH